MPWECFECTFVQEGSPSGRGPCIMCMYDNPLRIKVEVEDAGASPSPAPKITRTDVKMKDLMLDVASMKAFAEAITTESAAAVASAVAEEPAAAAAAVTMMGMGGGVTIQGSRVRRITPLSLPWISWRQVVHLWIATSLGLMLMFLV